jgi:hypothetical protein
MQVCFVRSLDRPHYARVYIDPGTSTQFFELLKEIGQDRAQCPTVRLLAVLSRTRSVTSHVCTDILRLLVIGLGGT